MACGQGAGKWAEVLGEVLSALGEAERSET